MRDRTGYHSGDDQQVKHAMTGKLLKIALLLTALLTVPVLLIRAQPYDDSDLRELLTPPADCAAPCFMGIKPGVTTFTQAVDKLERQGHYILRLNAPTYETLNGELFERITWRWNDSHPLLSSDGFNMIFAHEGIVRHVEINTAIPAIGMWWLYDKPYSMMRTGAGQMIEHYQFTYPQHGLLVIAGVHGCKPLHALTSSTRILFASAVETAGHDTAFSLQQFRNTSICRDE